MNFYDVLLAKKLNGGGGGGEAVLIDKSITANGTYNASTDNADGYKKVVVNVSGGGGLSVSSISATFTQGDNVVYNTATLNDLKPYLEVVATWSDSVQETVTDYTLSGTLTTGTSTITASYRGKTATFTVTVTNDNRLAYWDFTKSLVDEIGGNTFTLSAANGTVERTDKGLEFKCVDFVDYKGYATSDENNLFPLGSTFVIELGDCIPKKSGTGTQYGIAGNGGSGNAMLVNYPISMYWHAASHQWSIYTSAAWQDSWYDSTVGIDYFNNKKVVMKVNADGGGSITVGDTNICTVPSGTFSTDRKVFFGRSSGQTYNYFVVKKVTVFSGT